MRERNYATKEEWRRRGGAETETAREMGNGGESNRHSNALDMDIDMDLDGLAPTRKPARFQPKFKPKAKSKAKEEGEAEPAPQPSNPVLPKEEENKGSVQIIKQVKAETIDEKPVVVSLDTIQETKGEKIEKEAVDGPVTVTKEALKDEVGEEPTDFEAIDDVDGDDDEDGVVREIEVFFNPLPDTNTQLYVMQYPLRPSWRPYEFNDRCQQIRVKPKESKLEIDLEMNIGTDNYKEDQEVPEHLRLQKQTLTSSKVPSVTGYAVGILMENKLHLNPIHAVVQLRPSMVYLNADKIKKKFEAAGNSQAGTKFDEVIKEESTKLLNLPGKLATEASSEQLESWVPLEYHDVESPISSKYRQRMAPGESCHLQFSMTLSDYVNSLCPGTVDNGTNAKGPSLRSLLKLPLEERFKKLLSEGPHIHRFAALMHLAPEYSVENVLEVLQRYAVLVKGLWISKTSLRCEGVQVFARDYILLLFTKNQFVHRDQLKILKVPNDIIKSILCSLAVERTTFRDWKFKESEDLSFIKAHPDIVEVQKLAWSRCEKRITEAAFGPGKKGMARNPLNPSIGDKSATSSNQRAIGGLAGSQSSRSTTMSSEIRAALPKALLEVFHLHKVCSLQLISQGLRDMAVSKSTNPKADPRVAAAAARGANAPQSELQSVISEVAINIHGVYVLKTLGIPKLDPLRTIVINLLKAKKPNEKLMKSDITAAAEIVLKRKITTPEYQAVISELCTKSGNGWMLKSGDGRSK